MKLIVTKKTAKKKYKVNNFFYNNKLFNLFLLLCFGAFIFYWGYDPHEVDQNELISLNLTTKEKYKSGGRNFIKIYFSTKEYSNRFGISIGGVFGRWTPVTESLEANEYITIKIHKNSINDLNVENEVIPIYYLKSEKLGLIFDEKDFNNGKKGSDNMVLWLFIIVFVIYAWKTFSS